MNYADRYGMLRQVFWANGDYAVIVGPLGSGFIAVHQGDKISGQIHNTMSQAVGEVARSSKYVARGGI